MDRRRNWSFIGIPDHQGVINVHGRVGAAGGPAAFDRVFKRLKGRDGVHESLTVRVEAAPLGRDVAQNHRVAADAVREAHLKTGLSVVMGGGHDHGYSHLLGIREALQAQASKKLRLGCINLDAHLDVRKPEPLITSGSPFYLALEEGVLDPKRFIEFGIQRHCNGSELWRYVESKRVRVVPMEELRHGRAPEVFKKSLRKLATQCDAVVISLDLDSAAAAFAPGVSAPQAEGFSGSEVVEMMEIAGAEKRVVSLGIFELNPEHDRDDQTARLAATSAYHFIASRISG